MLTLQPAFSGNDRHAILHQIVEEDPRPPRRLRPEIPADLETIVLKAMAKGPQDRYITAQELADDLQRVLENRPIQARRPSLAQRVSKWAGRHSNMVATVSALMLVGLVLAVLGIAALVRQKSATEAALRQADERLRFARQAVQSMYERVATEWIADRRDLSLTQQDILKEMLGIYERLAADTDDTPQSRHELGVIRWRLADIRHRLGEYELARADYQTAVATLTALVQENPGDNASRLELSNATDNYGLLLQSLGELDAAHAVFLESARHLGMLRGIHPDKRLIDTRLLGRQINLAQLLAELGRCDEAEKLLRDTRAEFGHLAEREGEHTGPGVLGRVVRAPHQSVAASKPARGG